MDAVIALIIAVSLFAILTMAKMRHQHGLNGLTSQREAAHLAETTLSALQVGNAPPTTTATADDVQVKITPAEGGDQPPLDGQHWVNVHVTIDHRSAQLTGLVPNTAASG